MLTWTASAAGTVAAAADTLVDSTRVGKHTDHGNRQKKCYAFCCRNGVAFVSRVLSQTVVCSAALILAAVSDAPYYYYPSFVIRRNTKTRQMSGDTAMNI